MSGNTLRNASNQILVTLLFTLGDGQGRHGGRVAALGNVIIFPEFIVQSIPSIHVLYLVIHGDFLM